MNEELKKELDTLLDKYGVTLQIRQSIVFVPIQKTMDENEVTPTPEVEETPEVVEEVAEETAPEEVAE
jgi:hypothetical protein